MYVIDRQHFTACFNRIPISVLMASVHGSAA